MINNIDDHKEKFQYIFTKFDAKKQKEVPEILEDILEKMNLTEGEDKDELYYNLLDSLQIKAADGKIIFLNPLEDKHDRVLRELMSRDSIKYP